MYINREKLATHLFEKMDDFTFTEGTTEVGVDNIMSKQHQVQFLDQILQSLPSTPHEQVIKFAETFEVEQEDTYIVSEFKTSELRLRLLLEETIELASALGFHAGQLYKIYVELQAKVYDEEVPSNIKSVFDALLDIDYILHGTVHAFRLSEIFEEGMNEVHSSNMSKTVSVDVSPYYVKEIVEGLKNTGIDVESKIVNKNIIFLNGKTGKVLKPHTYTKPDLQTIIVKHLNIEP